MQIRIVLLVVGAAVLSAPGFIHAGVDSYSIDAHVLSAGTSARSASACFRMKATVAEPVAGFSSSANYAFSAGFRANTRSATRDDIFFSAFEDCTQ